MAAEHGNILKACWCYLPPPMQFRNMLAGRAFLA
jgi:hypothetical protein